MRSRAWMIAAALVIAAVVAVHHEVLFLGDVYHMDDAADGYYPSHVAILRAYGNGELPTWERATWCGFPLASDPYYGTFYPLTLLFAAFGAARGLGVTIAVHAAIAGCAVLALLRRRGLRVESALFGALSISLSTFVIERTRHVIFVQVLAWVAIALWAAEAYIEERRPRQLAIFAVAIGLALLTGALPLLPYLAAFGAAWLLPQRRARSALPALLGGALIGVAIGSAQLIPTLSHLPLSPRALGTDYAFASSYAWPSPAWIATLVAPDVFGRETAVWNHWELAGYYVGALAIVLTPFAIRRDRPELIAVFALLLVACGLALGDAGPLHPIAYRFVPLYAGMRCPARALVIVVVGAPLLAAHAVDRFFDRPITLRRALVVGAGTIALFAWFGVRGAAHLAILGPGIAAIALGATGRRAALCAVAFADLFLMSRARIEPVPRTAVTAGERFAVLEWARVNAQHDRIAFHADVPFRLHNAALTHELESVGGYDSFTLWRYVHFLHVLNSGHPYPAPRLMHDPAAGVVIRFGSRLVDLLGVRYAIARSSPGPQWTERFRLAPAVASATSDSATDHDLAVFENPRAMPRAFVVHRAWIVGDERAQAAALPQLDPRTNVILPELPDPAPAGIARSFSPARIVETTRHHVRIEVELDAAGVLVLTEAYHPSWRATLDGQPAAILPANLAFRGVAVPAGRHVVEMEFTSRATTIAVLLSALGVVAAVALARKR